MVTNGRCYICGMNAEVQRKASSGENIVNCDRCGVFFYYDQTKSYIESVGESKFIACAYYYFTHYAKKDKPYQVYGKSFRKEDDECRISVEEIMSLYPKMISERIDMTLMNLSVIDKKVGAKIVLMNQANILSPIFFLEEIDHKAGDVLSNFAKMLEDSALIKDFKIDPLRVSLIIDFMGWKRIDELQKQLATKNQGFIAMWFDPSMNKVEAAIKEAITESGYIPMIISDKEHNNQIVPELLYEIKESDFLIADLTGNRGGVYYEAGYAFGQGKEVIVTVNEEKEAPHFDVAQKNQVRYKTPEELKEKLIKRIRATVGDRSKEIH